VDKNVKEDSASFHGAQTCKIKNLPTQELSEELEEEEFEVSEIDSFSIDQNILEVPVKNQRRESSPPESIL